MLNHHVKVDIDRTLADEDDLQLLKNIFTVLAFNYDCDFDLDQLEQGDELSAAFESAADAQAFAEDLQESALSGVIGLTINAPKPLS